MTAPGAPALARRLAGLSALVRIEADAALRDIGEDVLGEARATLGAGPIDADGRLAASLTASVTPGTSTLAIASADPRAMALEFGTRAAGARPFLRPATEALRGKAGRRMRDALARALQRAKESP